MHAKTSTSTPVKINTPLMELFIPATIRTGKAVIAQILQIVHIVAIREIIFWTNCKVVKNSCETSWSCIFDASVKRAKAPKKFFDEFN